MSDSNDIALAIKAGSFVVAAIALLISAYNAYSSRRINEIGSLVDFSKKFAEYAAALDSIEKSSSAAFARRAFVNMANYVENLCSIYRRNYSTPLILENIEAMVSDYIAISNVELLPSKMSYQELIRSFGYGNDSYSDTHWFIETHKRLIFRKMEQMKPRHAGGDSRSNTITPLSAAS